MSEPHRIVAQSGLEPEVGRFFTVLEGLRGSLVAGVENLSTETIARRAYAGANTIGTLLIHLAEAELFWMQEVVEGCPLTREQREEYRFDIFGKPEAPQMEPRDIGYFRKRLDAAREVTLASLREMKDADLSGERTWEDGSNGDKRIFTVRWVLNHLQQHEAHHRGQIFLLKSALGR